MVDPATDPDKEAEANQTYGIQPTPFQVAGRYESSVINAYFDILVRYGDQNEVLNFRDLIEVQPRRDGTVDVRLRNLEYDLTRAIKKVVYGFQSVDTLLASLTAPVKLTLFVTPPRCPSTGGPRRTTIRKVAEELPAKSGGKLHLRGGRPRRGRRDGQPAADCSTPTSCARLPPRSSRSRPTTWTWSWRRRTRLRAMRSGSWSRRPAS